MIKSKGRPRRSDLDRLVGDYIAIAAPDPDIELSQTAFIEWVNRQQQAATERGEKSRRLSRTTIWEHDKRIPDESAHVRIAERLKRAGDDRTGSSAVARVQVRRARRNTEERIARLEQDLAQYKRWWAEAVEQIARVTYHLSHVPNLDAILQGSIPVPKPDRSASKAGAPRQSGKRGHGPSVRILR